MLSHVKLPYPGRPQVRGSEINRSAVGFQLILLIDIVWDRPLLYPYCFNIRYSSSPGCKAQTCEDTKPLKDEETIPLECEEFLQMLRPYFGFYLPKADGVIFDPQGRCHSNFFRDTDKLEYQTVERDWGFQDCFKLAEEVVDVIEAATGWVCAGYSP